MHTGSLGSGEKLSIRLEERDVPDLQGFFQPAPAPDVAEPEADKTRESVVVLRQGRQKQLFNCAIFFAICSVLFPIKYADNFGAGT